jgi:HAD superfamily hydrolase (TIGR01509 family)
MRHLVLKRYACSIPASSLLCSDIEKVEYKSRYGTILIMRSLELTDYIAAVSDFDDTILDNKPTASGQGLHERSRLDAIRTVGAARDLAILSETPAEMNAVAFHNASVHSAEGALWWLLMQRGIIEKEATFDVQHPLVQELIVATDISYRALLESEAQEVPGARDFFGKLYSKGFADRLAIASTGRRADILRFFDIHGFSDYFPPEHVFAKEDTQHPKPNPESFRRAIGSMGIRLSEASRVLAFEDDPRGIEAAKTLGMYTCALTTRFSATDLLSQPVPPDFVATDFNEYIEVFGL